MTSAAPMTRTPPTMPTEPRPIVEFVRRERTTIVGVLAGTATVANWIGSGVISPAEAAIFALLVWVVCAARVIEVGLERHAERRREAAEWAARSAAFAEMCDAKVEMRALMVRVDASIEDQVRVVGGVGK